jgi:dsDNA-specific endonuclease/ATPase MutS2
VTPGDLAALHEEVERLQEELDQQRTRAEASEQQVAELRGAIIEKAYEMSFGAREILMAAAAFAAEPFSPRRRTEMLAIVRRYAEQWKAQRDAHMASKGMVVAQ